MTEYSWQVEFPTFWGRTMITPGFDPYAIERPDARLLRYYFFMSLLTGPAFPIVMLSYYFRYVTLRYKFDAEGVSMSYGLLFRKEINLTYRRLQDIHLTHNLFQRWMGLATISLQTASGNASAEMTIEGVLQAEALRDFLYARMRGAKDEHLVDAAGQADIPLAQVVDSGAILGPTTPAIQCLIEIRDALQKLVDRQTDTRYEVHKP